MDQMLMAADGRGGAGRGQGRKEKPEAQRRHAVQFSLYPEDVNRLEKLTDNRSEWLRQIIERELQIQEQGKIVVLLTPAQLDDLRALVTALPA